MGVDFYECDYCEGIVCDAGPMFRCDKCGGKFHVECAGPEYVEWANPEFDEDDDRHYDFREQTREERCPVCTFKVLPDKKLLEFVLEKYKIDIKTIIEEYIAAEKAKKEG